MAFICLVKEGDFEPLTLVYLQQLTKDHKD